MRILLQQSSILLIPSSGNAQDSAPHQAYLSPSCRYSDAQMRLTYSTCALQVVGWMVTTLSSAGRCRRNTSGVSLCSHTANRSQILPEPPAMTVMMSFIAASKVLSNDAWQIRRFEQSYLRSRGLALPGAIDAALSIELQGAEIFDCRFAMRRLVLLSRGGRPR